MTEKPKQSVDKAIQVLPGVSIYKVENSRFWYVRVRDREKKRDVVRETKETVSIAPRRLLPFASDRLPRPHLVYNLNL